MASSTSDDMTGAEHLETRMRNVLLNNRDSPSASGQAQETVAVPSPPKNGRKRPNQAQRRNMSSQLVIPIDPRPRTLPPASYQNDQWNQNRGNHCRSNQSQSFRQTPRGPQRHNSSPHFQHNQNRQTQHQQSWSQGTIMSSPRGGRFNGSHFNSHQSQSQPINNSYGNGYDHCRQGSGSNIRPARQYHPNYHSHGQHQGWNQGYNQHQHQHQHQHQIYNNPQRSNGHKIERGAAYLEEISHAILKDSEIGADDLAAKNDFRVKLETICRDAVSEFEIDTNNIANFPPASVELRCFGSVASGFATKGSDMDLGLVTPLSSPQPADLGSPIPRLIEKAFLDKGYGARLLTRTRVPIIKLCERPTVVLLKQLIKEREKWEKGLDFDNKAPSSPTNELQTTEQSTLVSVIEKDPSTPTSTKRDADDDVDSPEPRSPEAASPMIVHGKIRISQQGNQTLNSYYTTARKLMVQLGVSDLEEYDHQLDPATLLTLNKICYAFIQGLIDDKLRQRLMSRPYNNFTKDETNLEVPVTDSDVPQPTILRSVAATYHLVEAEEHLMRWENRPSGLFGDELETAGSALADHMNIILGKSDFTQDEAIAYGRDIFSVLSRFKQLSIVQVVTMEQRQNEFASDYYNRANRLFRTLCPGGRGGSSQDAVGFFLYHYTHGVYKPEIRDVLVQFYNEQSQDPLLSPTLADLSLRHKSLQLAADFEAALEKGSYLEQRLYIAQYIEILKRPLVRLVTAGPRAWYKYGLPISPKEFSLIEHIKTLNDPSIIAQAKDKYRDELEFPKDGVGAQCDVNFSAHLALQNSLLLRCYSHTDPRVRQMVLFVKRWAKIRQINTPYRGSLSSYGYVLMVLHFLINVADPFVCPNLQKMAPPDNSYPPEQYPEKIECQGYNVRFMRDEEALMKACQEKTITTNSDSLGRLLCGFFEYYAQSGPMTTIAGRRGFDWGREVLSLRTSPGGILTKQAKGWTGAKTILVVDNASANTNSLRAAPALADTATESPTTAEPSTPSKASNPPSQDPNDVTLKEVRCRYLFAIEDPFELDHNVARTVTHHGISSIRDEFRRAWRLIQAARQGVPDEDLMEAVSLESQQDKNFLTLIESIHAHTPM